MRFFTLLSLLLILACAQPARASFVQSTTNAATGDVYPNAYWVPIVISLDFAQQTGHVVFACYEDSSHRAAMPGSYFATHEYDLNATSVVTFDAAFGASSGSNPVRVKAETLALAFLDTPQAGHTKTDGSPLVSFFASATHNTGTF